MKKTILIAAVMFFALSVSAFAQVTDRATFAVFSEMIDRVACCGLAEPTGALTFSTAINSGPSVSGSITIRYSVPIANIGTANGVNTTTPPYLQNVQVVPTVAGAATLQNVTNDPVNGNGIVVIGVNPTAPPFSFRVSNVRVNVSTNCGTNPVTVAISSQGNLIENGENTATVLNGTTQPLVLNPAPTAVTLNAANPTTTSTATVKVQENFLNAFGVTATTDPTQTIAHIIRLTLTGTLPAGVTITPPATDREGLFTLSTSAGVTTGVTPAAITTLPATFYYVLTTDSDPAVQETATFDFSINVTATQFPLSGGSVKVSAHLGPITTTATVVPRYSEGTCETDQAQLLTVTGAATTTLLVPYAVDLGDAQGDYQTGIVVSNTTKDPGASVMGFPAAIPQGGKLVVYFFPADGSTIAPWVSTDHPTFGSGLDSTGKLPAGGQFTAMVHQLFPSSVTAFSGYLFIVTDFTDAHGEFFISTFDNFTHGALMLVVAPTGLAGRAQSEMLDN